MFGNALDAKTGQPLFSKQAWDKANSVLELAHQGYLSDLGECAIALHGRGTRPSGKLVSILTVEDKSIAPNLHHLGEWAIASHGKGTHPFRKVANVDVNHNFTC